MADTTNILGDGLYRHSRLLVDEDAVLTWSVPERVAYEDRDDTWLHICGDGETLLHLAVEYYKDVFGARAIDMWEIIAQFQPTPIIDGSTALSGGQQILIPSISYIQNVALAERLSDTPEL